MPTRPPALATSACPRTSVATSTSGRPRGTTSPSPPGLRSWGRSRRRSRPRAPGSPWRSRAVSYTHLTLPTICSV
eukprot:4836795-Alexandrium_andersonii.AAC.1